VLDSPIWCLNLDRHLRSERQRMFTSAAGEPPSDQLVERFPTIVGPATARSVIAAASSPPRGSST
jgi:hypothetical protein